jgi:hypothetical protein
LFTKTRLPVTRIFTDGPASVFADFRVTTVDDGALPLITW